MEDAPPTLHRNQWNPKTTSGFSTEHSQLRRQQSHLTLSRAPPSGKTHRTSCREKLPITFCSSPKRLTMRRQHHFACCRSSRQNRRIALIASNKTKSCVWQRQKRHLSLPLPSQLVFQLQSSSWQKSLAHSLSETTPPGEGQCSFDESREGERETTTMAGPAHKWSKVNRRH